MLRQFFHNNDGNQPPSEAWIKHSAVKIFDKARLVVCVPIGSKVHHNAFPEGAITDDMKLSPAIRIPATVPIQWLKAQMQIVHPLNTSCVYMTQHGMYAGEARQVLTMNALRNVQDDGYILYWDDDTLPPQMGLYTMMNYMEQHPEVGVLSAVYCTRETPPEPVIYKESTHGVCWDFSMGPDAVPHEITAAGAGFMLARVSAIKAAMKMFPGEPVWGDMKTSREYEDEPHDPLWGCGMTWGHDIRFCKMIKAAGYKIMVDGRVECGHLDIASQVIHYLPDDSLPKRRGRKYFGEQYWNQVWGTQGVTQIRLAADLMLAVLGKIYKHSSVVEIGCGPGVMGGLLTAQGGVMWKGYDQSDVAVQMCTSKFLNAYQKSVHQLTAADLEEADVVLAMELVEHLQEEDCAHLMDLVTSLQKRFIFTVPNDCMGPGMKHGEEHVALFNEEKVREIVEPLQAKYGYDVEITKGDEKRLICVMTPKRESNEQANSIIDSANVRSASVCYESSPVVQEERVSNAPDRHSSGGLVPRLDEGRVSGLGAEGGSGPDSVLRGERGADEVVECRAPGGEAD